MAEETKTILFYLLALGGLIIGSILFTGRIESLPLEPQPPARPIEVTQEGCSTNSERNIFYIPDPTSLEPNRLLISGTVYASDLVTPLPGALLEVLLVVKESYYPPYEAFHDWLQTDEAGYYEATIPKSAHYGIIYLYYRANSQADCPLKLQLFFIDEPALGDAVLVSKDLMKLGLEQTEITGSVLRGVWQGNFDVILPASPPQP